MLRVLSALALLVVTANPVIASACPMGMAGTHEVSATPSAPAAHEHGRADHAAPPPASHEGDHAPAPCLVLMACGAFAVTPAPSPVSLRTTLTGVVRHRPAAAPRSATRLPELPPPRPI